MKTQNSKNTAKRDKKHYFSDQSSKIMDENSPNLKLPTFQATAMNTVYLCTKNRVTSSNAVD